MYTVLQKKHCTNYLIPYKPLLTASLLLLSDGQWLTISI